MYPATCIQLEPPLKNNYTMPLTRITILSAVREILRKADSQHAPLVISLTENGKNRSFDCKLPGRLIFGPEKDDFPSLGKNQSPSNSNPLPSPEDLQRLLIADLHTSRQRHIYNSNKTMRPAADEPQTDDDEPEQLNRLTDADHGASGVVGNCSALLLNVELGISSQVGMKGTIREVRFDQAHLGKFSPTLVFDMTLRLGILPACVQSSFLLYNEWCTE
ncbi:uncharacterized protein M421DRAFT_94743 [Didymella exigua CBS 183.55]|uniref:Uncharacterized protein n=1 Tax=Didymella exigua CBS 183.55 TaxID=1150837 RepID=A0A6A5RE28_9PLEO|nr:uncharacterized protein M421DRAFT_94743 [Didymella exigua CBS 183.55]KAF1925478.1 hypothetical protein M421DRAFT_94743 [Didymella exigua CBS 183.55]